MIKVDILEPDRACIYRDLHGKQDKLILHHSKENDIRKWLEDAGCTEIEFSDYDFQDWLDEAELATQRAIANHDAPGFEFEDDVWKAIRPYLRTLFNRKCAYCEVKIETANWAQVEHYRPKKPVAGEAGHKGYYWLAYQIENYLPACGRCNASKGSRFPLLEGGIRAQQPNDDLEQELPALLNPAVDPPDRDLTFLTKKKGQIAGAVAPKKGSKRGDETIDTVKLNRVDMVERRREKQEQLAVNLGKAMMNIMSQPDGIKILFQTLRNGKEECSAAQLAQAKALTAHLGEAACG